MLNAGALNSFTLNGVVSDPVVRTRVAVLAYGRGQSTPRVLAYARVDASARAAAANGARVLVRTGVLGSAHAQAVAMPRTHGRLRVASQPKAQSWLDMAVRAALHAMAHAQGAATPRVEARLAVAVVPQAATTVAGGVRRRAAVAGTPGVYAEVNAVVFGRGYWRSPVVQLVRAASVVDDRVHARLVLDASAQAQGQALAKTLVRAPFAAHGLAQGVVDFSVFKQMRWTDYAPMERSFVVPADVFVFFVTE